MEKQRSEESERRREREQRKKMQVHEKEGKSRFTAFFQWLICSSGESKSRLAKAAGAKPCGQMRHAKLHALAARSKFASEKVKNTLCSDHFWTLSWDVEKVHAHVAKSTFSSQNVLLHTIAGPFLEVEMSEKVHAVVARSTFSCQNVQNTTCTDHFWKLQCRKSARRCGAKHI